MADTPSNKPNTNEADKGTPDLLTRLSNYTLVNSVVQQYHYVKSVSPIIKAGLETAEGATSKVVGIAQPVIAPVITKLDNALHLEEAANKVLDKTEEISNKVANAYQQGVAQSETLKTQTVESAKTIAQLSRDVVVHNIETTKDKIASYTNKPVNQILDYTEAVVNSILPPELELEPIDIHEDVPTTDAPATEPSAPTQPEKQTDNAGPDRLQANPLPRIVNFGGGVGKRVKRVALSKLQNLSFRNPSDVNAVGYVVDLIQYTADYIDVDQKRQAIAGATENIQHFFEEKKEQTAKLVYPVKEIIEKQTQDLKEQSVKSVVAIVASIAHTTEVVRRQFIGQVPDVAQLQQNLAQITERTKNIVTSLKEPQLSQYLAYVRGSYHNALEALINLTQAYSTAVHSYPLVQNTETYLQNWRNSVFSRISYYAQLPTTTSAAPAPTKSTSEVPPSEPLTPVKPTAEPSKIAEVVPETPQKSDS